MCIDSISNVKFEELKLAQDRSFDVEQVYKEMRLEIKKKSSTIPASETYVVSSEIVSGKSTPQMRSRSLMHTYNSPLYAANIVSLEK